MATAFPYDRSNAQEDDTQAAKVRALHEHTVNACTDAMNAYMSLNKKSPKEAAAETCRKLPVCVELLGLDCSGAATPSMPDTTNHDQSAASDTQVKPQSTSAQPSDTAQSASKKSIDASPSKTTDSDQQTLSTSSKSKSDSSTSTKDKSSDSQSSNNSSNTNNNSAADIQSCQALARSAITCCNNPETCGGASASSITPVDTSTNAGVQEYCRQLQAANLNGGSTNSQAANACMQRYGNCYSTCSQLAGKYSDQQNVAQNLQSTAQNCLGLSSKVSQLTAQSNNNLDAANSGINCQQNTQSSPNSNGATPQSTQGASATPSSTSASAQTAATTGAGFAAEKGQAGMITATNKNGQFNLGSNSDAEQGMTKQIGGGNVGTPPKVNEIPGGGGGGMGGMGGGAKGALVAGAAGRGAPGSPGYTTDIDKGFRSGGGTLPTGGSLQTNTAGLGEAYGGGAQAEEKIDLRDFLPGGKRDPAAVAAFAEKLKGMGINGKHVDIWQRISDRLTLKCKLGELYDCN